MKKLPVLIPILLCFLNVHAQKTEILQRSADSYKKVSDFASFQLIDSSLNGPEMKFVANIRAKMKRSLNCYDDLFWLQTRIENVARDLGANSFQVKGFSIDDSSKMVSLTLMTYLSPDSLLKHTEEMPHNSMLYVFPSTARYTNKPFILHVNDKKVSLGYREYFAYHISPGEIIGIRKGIAAERIVGYPGSPAIALAHAKFAVLNNESGQFNEMPLSNMKLLLETYFKYPKTIDFRH